MIQFQNNFTRAHVYVFTVIWILFGLLTFYVVNRGLDEGDQHHATVLITTFFTFTGPMNGAISRSFQGCCLEASLSLLPYCGIFPIVGIAVQVVRWPFQRFASVLRLIIWGVGWFGWFAGGILSLGHALS
ncbi:hypothetical protein K8I31_16230 [bacterium]|nr:hypothetical protein [bacterium]